MSSPFIADEHEIRNLVHRYADAASRRDPIGVASTFTAGGEWQAPELGRFQGRDAMVEFFTSMLNGWNTFLQGLMSGVVVLDATNPDRAAGRAGNGTPVRHASHHDDRYCCSPAR